MKAMTGALILAAVISLSAASVNAKDEAKKDEPKPVTLTGELVDTGCYLGSGAKGAEHKGCAARCIAGGMPMGLLTADGTFYLLTMSHSSADPYNQAKEMAALMVDITGPVHERSGMKSIEVTAIAEAKPAAK